MKQRFSRFVPILAVVCSVGLCVCVETSHAQDDLPGGLDQLLAEKCTGPLGALMPECSAAKSGITVGPGARPASAGVPSLAASTPGPRDVPSAPAPAPVPAADAPNEFQRFAASSVGGILPIFGSSLFSNVPTTFAPLDRIPVTADYVVGPGDEILLRAWGQINLNLELTVDRTGSIYIPQVGNLTVTGLKFEQLQGFIKSHMERVYRNFELNVTMGQLRSIQIFVMGQARRPGTYTVSSLSTLVNAIFASGGPTSQGSMRRIQLKRANVVAAEIDIYDLLLKGDKSKDICLLPGDIVYIPSVGPQVAVAGSVRTPGVYELKSENTLADILQLAGGLAPTADTKRATLERISAGKTREVLDLALDQVGRAVAIKDADILRVNSITPRFENAVTLRGNVANPGRFVWRQGMRLRNIIPDKDSLITRAYWTKRNSFGFSPPEEVDAEKSPKPAGLAGSVPEINWSYAVIERQDPKTLVSQLIPFNLGKLILQNDPTENLELQCGDVVTIFSQRDVAVPQNQRNRYIRLEGEFAIPGIYLAKPGESLGELIQRAGGFTPQAYLFGAEFLRESVRADQQKRLDQFMTEMEKQLEKAASGKLKAAATPEEAQTLTAQIDRERTVLDRLRSTPATGRIVLNLTPGSNDNKPLTDLTLEDGDRFVVPSRPATINVLGAVYNPNSFVYESSRQIRDYIRKTGGYTRTADSGHTFIIRADGSVIPKHGSGLFRSSFESEHLNPGDTVVVPESMFKGSFMRGLRDWSQVLSGFGLAAAAINVLR